MRELVIEIKFVDRFGLGFEIFEVFKNQQVYILATEAFAHESMGIKFSDPGETRLRALTDCLLAIKGVTGYRFHRHLRCEQREHELRTILNSVNEGVVAVNAVGRITHVNEVACTTLGVNKPELMGKKIEDVPGLSSPLRESLESGQRVKHREVKEKREQGLVHFLASSAPILDENQHVIGAVATIKDYHHVQEIISKLGRTGLTTFDEIIFQSPKMKRVVETAKTVAKGNSTILLRGESGTGKELFARAVHMESNRAQGPFVTINCGALPDSLLESELFGYEEGAFTGAVKGGKKGLFEQANGGTLFLDEVGEISPPVQIRLLRVLQEGTLRRVGSTGEISVDVRIIAATHRNLEQMIEQNMFREDLYYRLNVIPLRIPPLRERIEDIPLIAQHLIRKICNKLHRPEVCLTQQSLQFLMAQEWRGNVRQLENVLERVINLQEISQITPADLAEWSAWPSTNPDCLTVDIPVEQTDLREELAAKVLTSGKCDSGIAVVRPRDPVLNIQIPLNYKAVPLKATLNEVEKQILLAVLEKYPSSRKAGKILGVSGTTILNKISSLGIALNQLEEEI